MIKLSKLGVMQGRLSPPFKNNIQHFPHQNWSEEFIIAKDLNLNSIQWIYEHENNQLNPLYYDPDEINMISKKSGILVNSVILDYFMNKKLFNENKNHLNENFNHLEFIVKQSIRANIKIIEIPFVDEASLKKIDDFDQFILNFKKFLSLFSNEKIFISLETDLNPINFIKLIQKLEPFRVFANYDMGNSTSNNIDPKEEILMMKNYIINVHIKDRKSNFGPTVPLGKGDTNFNNIFSLLYNIKYNGDYIIQAARKDILHPYTSNHIDTVKDYISFIQNFCK